MGHTPARSAANTDIEREIRRVLYETGVVESNEADLISQSPQKALEKYLETNPEENLPTTMRSHKSRLNHFIYWCTNVAGIIDLNDVTGPELVAFKKHQVSEGYAPRTIKSQLETLCVFLRFCRSKQYVRSELPYLVPDIDVSPDNAARDRLLDRDRAQTILKHLSTFQYASREHVAWLLLAENGLRLCTLIALDLQDYSPPTEEEPGYLDLQHRPNTGTRLKNGTKSERQVTLSGGLCTAVDDYIAHQRPEATDEYGRDPLLTTATGRIAEATVRTYVNKWSAPCKLTNECPHGRTIDDCVAAQEVGNMDCPSKRSPHDIRRGYITNLRRYGVPKEIISEEVDASVAVIEEHYDKTTKAEQRKIRTAAMDAVLNANADTANQ